MDDLHALYPTDEEEEYFCAFSEAVDDGNYDLIKLLIRKEGILTKLLNWDRSFLHIVAERGSIETAIEICKLGANVNIAGVGNGETPLHCAVKNSVKMVDCLIANGADIMKKNRAGETPIQCAAKCSTESVKFLLERGANVNNLSLNGSSSLHEAMYSGSEEITRVILNKHLLEIQNDCKPVETTKEIITTILQNKADLNICKEDYPLLILFAARSSDEDILKLVLNDYQNNFKSLKNSNTDYPHQEQMCVAFSSEVLNSKGRFQRTALHLAVRKQYPEVVSFLLNHGADVNCKTTKGYTPFHYAAQTKNEEICKILWNFRAKINSSGKHSSKRHPSLTHLIESQGELCHIFLKEIEPDCYGGGEYESQLISSPLTKNNLNVFKLLLQFGNNPESFAGNMFSELCQYGSPEILKTLIEYGAQGWVRDKDENRAIIHAAMSNSLELVDLLLEYGLNIDCRNCHDNCTALLTLLKSYIPFEIDMIEYLVDRGADINARNYEEATALHIACVYSESQYRVEYLLELGADVKLNHEILPEEESQTYIFNEFGDGRKTLVASIALRENKLGDYINYYFKYSVRSVELPKVFEYFDKCKLEIEKLKSRRIVQDSQDLQVSFFHFLTCSFYEAVSVVKIEEVRKVFVVPEYETEFPLYSFLLKRRFERTIVLKDAVEKTMNFLKTCLSPLSTDTISMILNYFSSSDFRKFNRQLSKSQNIMEQEEDPRLIFRKIYKRAKIVEIRENGIMVSLYYKMPPAFLSHAPNLNWKVGDEILVEYLGRYPESKEMRLFAVNYQKINY